MFTIFKGLAKSHQLTENRTDEKGNDIKQGIHGRKKFEINELRTTVKLNWMEKVIT